MVQVQIRENQWEATMLWMPNEEGQGLAEYGLILVLIAVAVIAIMTLLSEEVQRLFSQIDSALMPGI
jgi:pilus assembly protein Flp/PilA